VYRVHSAETGADDEDVERSVPYRDVAAGLLW
jgi:hypothetical protein